MAFKSNIRIYRNEDIKVLLEWTSEEGWDFSEIDCMASLDVDPKGLLVAEDESETPVGFIGLFNMSPKMTYLNAFIVRKDLRGQGIGRKLWTAMLNATEGNILVLDSVSEMREWYKRQGLSHEAYCAKVCQGTISSYESVTLQNSYTIVPLSDDILSALVTYDKQVYPYSREHAVRARFSGKDRYSVVAFLEKNVVGYANYHWKSKEECNIRALYADNDVIAETLLLNVLENIPHGSFVSFFLLEDKSLPKYLSSFKCTLNIYKLFTEEIGRRIQTDKIIFGTDYMI